MARRLVVPPVPRIRPAGSWLPQIGFRKLLPPSRPPVGAYVTPVTAPIGGNGVAQSVVGGFSTASGSVSSPAAYQTIAYVLVPAGTWEIDWSVTLSGTLGAQDADNFQLYAGVTLAATSVNPDTAGTYAQTPVQVALNAAAYLTLTAGPAAPSSGAVYGGSITGQGGTATVQVGPSGLGTRWYPQQVTLATTSGASDTSTATGYLGPAAVPSAIVFVSYAGGGDVQGLAVPMMQPGDLLTVVWSGGHPGDYAQLAVIGSQSALGPG